MTQGDSPDSPGHAGKPEGSGSHAISRVGLLLEGLLQPAWACTTIRKLLGAPGVSISLLVLTAKAGSRPRGPGSTLRRLAGHGLVAAFERFDEGLLAAPPDPFVTEDLRPLFDSVPMLKTHMYQSDGGWQLPTDDVETIRDAGLDALLYFGEQRMFLRGAVSAAQHGLWLFHHGSPPPYEGARSGFWETLAREMTATVSLVALTDDGAKDLVTSVIAARHLSPARTRRAAYWTSTSFPERALKRLHHDEDRPPEQERQTEASAPPARQEPRGGPSEVPSRTLIRYLPGYLSRAGRETAKALLGNHQWLLALAWADDGMLPRLKTPSLIVPPEDRFWADPQVIEREGRYYVFVEEVLFAKKRGRIAVLIVDRSGKIGGPITVLERPYHLSYPFLFEHADELYMVPETSENGTIELYRCVEFPTEWEFVRDLMQGVRAVDSTLLFRSGRWWLFTSIYEAKASDLNSELSLFSSDDPLTTGWTPHPHNPIVCDARRARPAGPIFERHGRLMRPSQQTVPEYGHAIWLNEIVSLTEDEYQEASLTCLLPDWQEGLTGTHTLSRAGDLTVVDGCRWRPRRPAGRAHTRRSASASCSRSPSEHVGPAAKDTTAV